MIDATLHARLLEFSARLIYREVDSETLTSLRSSPILAMLQSVEPQIESELAGLETELIELYAEEFARLFVLPSGVNPHASAWIGAEPTQQGTVISEWVNEWTESLKIELSLSEWGRLPRDHFAILAGLLAIAQLKLVSSGNDAKLGALVATIHSHAIEPWFAEFGKKLRLESKTALYRAVGRMTEVLADNSLVSHQV